MCFESQHCARSVTRERAHPHLAVLRPLLELDSELVKPLDSSLKVINGNADVAESSSWIIVARSVPLEVGVRLFIWHQYHPRSPTKNPDTLTGTPVVAELENTFSSSE